MHQQLEELNQKLDKAKSARNHEPLAFDERRTLQREISTLKYEQKKLHNNFRNNAGFNKMLQCYDHCIRMHQIKFRIQMGDHFEKKTLNGVYRKRYRRYSDSRYYRHKRNHRRERIYWYDGNGYWIVTFTCNEHGNTWTGEKAQEHQRLLEEYQNGHRRNDADQYRRRYIALEKLIRQKQQQLDKSFKTPDPNERTENIAALNRQYRRISSEIDRKKNEISRLNRLISRSEN